MKSSFFCMLSISVLLMFAPAGMSQIAPQGKYITFNGTDQNMTITDHADFDIAAGESYTMAFRFRQVNFTNIYRIFGKGNLNVSGGRYELYTNNSATSANLALNLRNADNTNIGSPYVTTLQAAKWVHFAWVYNAADHTSKVYLDGALLNTISQAVIGTKTVENAMDLLIGCGLSNATAPVKSFYWPGDLDELRIWKRALTAAEVTADGTAATADNNSLVAAYNFENINGDVVPDLTGKGHDGKLSGYGVRVVRTTLPAGAGNADERLAAFRAVITGRNSTMKSVTFSLKGTTDIDDFSNIKVYYNGGAERLDLENAYLFGSASPVAGNITVTGEVPLIDGENYFWITGDLIPAAKEGNQIGAVPVSYKLGDNTEVAIPETAGTRTILLTSKLLFSSGDGGSQSYRIPAIVTAADNSLVTATDKRWNGSADLPNHIDVIARRSTDKGVTWSEPVIIAGTGTTMGYGDPALVLNRKNGEIICLFASDKGWGTSTATAPIRINISKSADNGLTWSTPVDLTSQIYGATCADPISKNWQAAFVASGSALQLRNGRLMAVVAAREANGTVSDFVIYSDDNAASWKVSTNNACPNGDEAKVVELDNGDVLMSVRHSGHRLFNFSRDHGITWGTPIDMNAITDPFCNGDLIRYTALSDGFEKNRLLHSIPFASSRQNVSVLLSYDEGQTWPIRKTIYSGSSAYSALNILDDGTIGIYYEVGEYETYQMYFVRFSLDWLSGGTDKWTKAYSSAHKTALEPADYQLYPNPARNRLTITGPLLPDTNIRIFNLSGQLLAGNKISDYRESMEISLDGFRPGVYFMRIGEAALRFEVGR